MNEPCCVCGKPAVVALIFKTAWRLWGSMMELCKHCRLRPQGQRKRGLCWKCFDRPKIRAQYSMERQEPEPTEAELNELIEKQMKRLPKWWSKENPED